MDRVVEDTLLMKEKFINKGIRNPKESITKGKKRNDRTTPTTPDPALIMPECNQ